MSAFTVKRVGLSAVTIITIGGVIKVSVDASSPNVVPLISSSELSLPPPAIDKTKGNELTSESRSRQRTKRAKVEETPKSSIYSNYFTTPTKTESEILRDREDFQKIQKIDSYLARRGVSPEDIQRETSRKGKEGIRRTWKEAEDIYETLHDYSFKLFGPCVYGTGWVLDYQLPEKQGTYPTTWYIATNAHVISKFRFGSNPYNQLLPFSEESTKILREKEWSQHWRDQHKTVALDDVRWKHCDSSNNYGYFDINIAKNQEALNRSRNADYGLFGQGKIEEPKLFFAAFDFLKPNSEVAENHYSDFVVLEIEFKDPQFAKTVTDGFADKYGVDSTDAIDIFGLPLESRGLENLNSLDDNFYILAYLGGNGHKSNNSKWLPTKNFDESSGIASRLGGESNLELKKYRGFTRNKKMIPYDSLSWGGKVFREFGHAYEMIYNPLAKGSSGGLLVDKNKKALSLNTASSAGYAGGYTSFGTPLRSSGITFMDAGDLITTPKFDLIVGVEGQKNSYKQQVMEYIVNKKNKNTWLNARNWQHVTEKPERYPTETWF